MAKSPEGRRVQVRLPEEVIEALQEHANIHYNGNREISIKAACAEFIKRLEEKAPKC